MTPKEKAQELINKMLMYSEFIYDAQKNALIAVDELISETGKKYWYDVKQEIEDI